MKTMIVWLGAAMVLLAGSAPAQTTLPQFQADPLWPKALPNNWILGQGIATDKYDRIGGGFNRAIAGRCNQSQCGEV
jgi:hypothetical protein